MIIYEIPGKPLRWQRAGIAGTRFYDPQFKAKKAIQEFLADALEDEMPYTKGLKLTVECHMPIPKSLSRVKRLKALGKPHILTPDLSNLVKFLEDTLNDIVWQDDKLIYEIHARKIYGDEAKTRFMIEEYHDQKLWNLIPE